MRKPKIGTRAQPLSGRIREQAGAFWKKATRAASADIDDARREYITKVICFIIGLIALVFSIIFFFGWIFGRTPADSILIALSMGTILIAGWIISLRGHWRVSAFLPPLMVYLIGVYGYVIGGEGAPSLAFFALSILMAALLKGGVAPWIMAILSITAYFLVGMAHLMGFILPTRTLEAMFVNRLFILSAVFIGMTVLLSFLDRRYRMALAEADKTAALLAEHAERLGVTNLMLEKENAERRRVQDALQESEERYRSLLNNIPDIVYSINEKGEILSVNEESLKIFGYTKEEVTGRPFMEIIHPDDLHIPYDAFLSTIRDRREYTAGLQYRILDRMGKSHWVEVHSHARFDPGGAFIQEEGVLRDITDRRQAQEALAESEERYRSLFEDSRDAILILEPPSWRFARINRTGLKMFGAGTVEITTLGPWDLLPELQPDGEPSVAKIRKHIDMALKEGWHFSEWQFRRLDGSEFPGTILLSRVEQGEPTILQATIRDITERKRAEELVKTSLKEKEVLLREIHHRVKNNFQVIMSLLNLQSRNMTDPELLKQFDDSSNRIRAMALVHEKLYQSSDLSEIDFSSYLKTITEDLAGTYSLIRKRPQIVIDAEEAALGIDQAIPCGLIVNELITNALKYAFTDDTADNRLTIRLRKDETGIISIQVSDNGPGLPAGIDIDKTQTLGLQLVSLLTRQIRGTRRLDREGRTTWTIVFPARIISQKEAKSS
ncbi:MAG TPA: PAS domain S-box protein [Spirochaetota bacterium]|nr:PAS domain S-box protein [Spirochaetota bacterium]HOD13594.1 PAS domain S-box protein [Spirochaetota bacterium]HPN10418.1 PAS domain S-box protein [Spirochaetota bacterium]